MTCENAEEKRYIVQMHEMQSSYQQKLNKLNQLHILTKIYKTEVVITQFINE